MGYKEIEKLLEKYFEGASSLEEEQALRDFFASTDELRPEWKHAKAMLGHFAGEGKVTFEAPVVRMQAHRRRNKLWRLSGVAASIVILIAAGWFYLQPLREPMAYAYINGKAITQKEVALEEMKKALMLMSDNLNQGTKSLSKLSKLEQVKQSIAKKKQQ